jgi:DNA-binding MarR family transcriptional regulator
MSKRTDEGASAMNADIREVAGCTCLRLRRTTRRVTQVYDHLLEPTGLTVNQFGLLAHLYGVSVARPEGLAIGALAERIGTDPTTLNRSLKPLQALDLVSDAIHPRDRRVRTLSITSKGRGRLQRAVPFWREAQAQVEDALGVEAIVALNGLLDLSSAKLPKR